MTWQNTYIPPQGFKLPAYTWGKDRKLCERCTWFIAVENTPTHTQLERSITMLCKKSKMHSGAHAHGVCIDMRAEGAACGKDGKLFKEK